ncbi:hypothetical protein IP81_01690 [Novosphingobium sp. AAP83]|uniref:LuxR C-terminal-related transcriptional regulator n=1 Tax=Novosphingobium sp. AAP83 TaxID=1523425 RepID=UPI0006B96B1A|nr:LuxR C-terminal-related transcriptional regulator [Novosphingobium sp. AAP83]KPF93873.1 hypothetical protein IP81_01690 [Novosphingobium sp. AAP83]
MKDHANSLTGSTMPLHVTVSGNARLVGLTQRQTEILRGVVWGKNAEEIGRWLGISSRTVEVHRSQILHRLGAKNGADATRLALVAGFNFGSEPDPRREAPQIVCSVQKSPHASGKSQAQSGATAAESLSEPAVRSELASGKVLADVVARVIGFQDVDYLKRLGWFHSWLKVESGHVYIPWETRILSQAESSFGLLAVHGSDARRVANAFRKFRKIYPGKIMIALLGNATPQERASVYRAGADAVYSLQSDSAVATAWLTRALERQAHQDALKREEERAKGISISKLAKLIGEAQLTTFERKALSLFEAARGGVVTFTKLSRARPRGEIAPGHKPISVYISRLNKKLQGFPQIKSVRDEGYRIDVSDLQEAYEYWKKEVEIHSSDTSIYSENGKFSNWLPPNI